MRNVFLIILIFSSIYSQENRLVVSILDFKGDDVSEKILKASFQRLETSLIQSNRFTVVDKNERDEVLKEQKFQQSGLCDDECIVDLGKNLGAEYLVIGEIIEFPGLYQIDLKIISVETGETTKKVTSEIEGGMKQLLSGIEEASREIVRQIATGNEVSPIVQQEGIILAEKKYSDVLVESNPPGAIVMIDGIEKGFTPIMIEKVEIGTRSLMLIKPGHETLSKGIIINEGQTTNVTEVLVPKTGSLTILSDPVGGMVFIEGVPKGPTPIDLSGLIVKNYIIDVELENYKKVTQRVTVQYNENTTQKFQLEPLPGTVNAIMDPVTAIVEIYGKQYKSSGSGITKITLPVGTHKLKIKNKGYETQTKAVVIGPNESLAIEINLKKKPAGISSNPDIGFLTVNSLNDKVKLKISKVRQIQELPLDYYELKYGVYNLKAFKKGFESKKETVNIKRQETKRIEINLKKKTANKALKYSMLFPGGGQIYAESFQRALIYSATSIVMAGLLGQSIGTLQTENDLMDQYYNDYRSATSAEQINSSWDTYNNQVKVVNDTQKQLLVFSGVLVGSWFISIIDAFYFTGLR